MGKQRFIKIEIYNIIMATKLKDKDFVRKVRNGSKETIISLSEKFLKENNISVGDYIDLRNLKKVVKENP